MTAITVHKWNEQGIYAGSVEVLETDPMPPRSTPTPPPECEGEQVAFWQSGWVVIDSAPDTPELPTATSAQIDAERDRRIDAGFMFGGKLIQSRGDDRENIAGAALAAFMALSSGVAPDDLGWEGDGEDFYWITQDNTMLPLGPQGVIDLGLAATAHKAAHIRAGFALKEMSPRPADYGDDSYWPTAPEAEPVIAARPA